MAVQRSWALSLGFSAVTLIYTFSFNSSRFMHNKINAGFVCICFVVRKIPKNRCILKSQIEWNDLIQHFLYVFECYSYSTYSYSHEQCSLWLEMYRNFKSNFFKKDYVVQRIAVYRRKLVAKPHRSFVTPSHGARKKMKIGFTS